mmetsp:Transcript_21193/g.44382  ORF Transcript_21193/g.44382 Transcript_21193/m.44382 type:complete len:118 (-) Transcript_21193:2402-2755(-)
MRDALSDGERMPHGRNLLFRHEMRREDACPDASPDEEADGLADACSHGESDGVGCSVVEPDGEFGAVGGAHETGTDEVADEVADEEADVVAVDGCADGDVLRVELAGCHEQMSREVS